MGFLVTGYGRSGTKFLATQLNKSKAFTVSHEFPSELRRLDPPKEPTRYTSDFIRRVKEYLARPNVGDVNGRLRYHYGQLGCMAIILRSVPDIMVSVANRKPKHTWEHHAEDLAKCYGRFHDSIGLGRAWAIHFDTMTKDADYLMDVARRLGVEDLEGVELAPINETRRRKVEYRDLPVSIRKML
jgi:hypothetical protein